MCALAKVLGTVDPLQVPNDWSVGNRSGERGVEGRRWGDVVVGVGGFRATYSQ